MRQHYRFFRHHAAAFYVLATVLTLALVGLASGGVANAAASAQPDRIEIAHIRPHTFPAHAYAGHGLNPNVQRAGLDSSLLLLYNGGQVMKDTSTNYAIFWEPQHLQNGDAGYVSPTYNSLLQRYFNDIGGSPLYSNNTQYYDTTGHIVASSSLGGAWVDTSAYPASACSDSITPGNCLSDLQIQSEVQKAITTNSWSGGLAHMFFVFTASGEGSCFDAGSSACSFTQYCGYHSYYTDNSNTPFIYANMPYTGTLLAGCGVPLTANHDAAADSTISVTSHEQMEAVTDPLLNAWYDANGNEIGDKCAWNFGSPSLENGNANVEWNSHFYIVQQEWSNAIADCALSGQPTPPPVSSMVFTGSNDGNLYALNAAGGTLLWSYKTGGALVSSPLATKNTLYVGSNDGSIYALKTHDGTLVWKVKTGGPVASSPILGGSMLYIGSSDGNLYALNAANGKLVWRYHTGHAMTSTPALSGATLFASDNSGYLYALSASRGNLLWYDRLSGASFTSAVVASGRVYVGASNGSLYALRADHGKQLWRYQLGRARVTTPVVAANMVYAGSESGTLVALDAQRGTKRWSYTASGNLAAPAYVSNGVVYVGSSASNLYALNASNGSVVWQYATGAAVFSTPVVANGTVYFGCDDHDLYAVDATLGSESWHYATGGKVESSPFVLQLN